MILQHQKFLTIAVFLHLAMRLQADPILTLTFDDPVGVLAQFSDGISRQEIERSEALRDANVASGSGGKAHLKIEGEEIPEGGESPKSLQVIVDSAMGTKAFLRVMNDRQISGTRGIVIAPDAVETSLASISLIEKGKVVLNGGLDMFFRFSEENPSQQELLPNLLSTGGDGLRLIVEADQGSIAGTLFVDQEESIFDTDLDGVADANRVKTQFVKAVPIDPEAPYHLAVLFETDDAEVITLSVFLKDGNGAINTKQEDDLVSKATFSVISENPDMSLDKGSIFIGAHSRTSPSKVILDLAAFRIFKPAPATFPDISGNE